MTRTRSGGRDLFQILLVMASLTANYSVTAFSVPPVPTTRTTSSRSQSRQAWERSALSELQETQVQGQIVQGPTLPTGADYGAYCVSSASSCTQETEPTILECPSLPSDFPIGTYYRNGGARFESDDGTLVVHPFDADGMVCAATFDPTNQRILFRNAFVETEGYLEDRATGKMTKRGIFGTMRSGGVLSNIFRTDFKNVANTNVVFAGDQLYALWEGGKPYLLDPLTLKNAKAPGVEGETDLDGLLGESGSLSAHPRYDSVKDVWLTFGYTFDPQTSRTEVDLYELDAGTFRSTRSGRLRFTKEGPGLIHDFIVSENYMIFNLNKAAVSAKAGLKAILGMGAFAEFINLDEDATDTQIVLIPRSLFDEVMEDGSEIVLDVLNDQRIKVVDLPFHFNFHFSNCYEDEKGQVVFETVQTIQRDLLKPPPPPETGARLTENPKIWEWLYPSIITQYSLDPQKESLSVDVAPKILVQRPSEFPTVPKDLSTRKHRYLYASGSHREIPGSSPQKRSSGPQQGSLIKVDTQDPTQNEVYEFEPYEFIGESCFVPKVGKDITDPSQEDAGYLLSYLVNGRERTTDLVIFDVEGKGAIQKGPVAQIPLPAFVPQGLHGCFAPGVTFDLDQYENTRSRR